MTPIKTFAIILIVIINFALILIIIDYKRHKQNKKNMKTKNTPATRSAFYQAKQRGDKQARALLILIIASLLISIII